LALAGKWAGGGALLASEPLAVARSDEDPFDVISRCPEVENAPAGTVGGGWFGYLGYQLCSRIEKLPVPPPRLRQVPYFDLAFYDHLLRYETETKQWWFEALWTPERAAALARRLALLRNRLQAPPEPERPYAMGPFETFPSGERHRAAVDCCVDHIWAGDVFQVNLCLRLEANFGGDPLDLFCSCSAGLVPDYSALIRTAQVAVVSLSPELFLKRSGRAISSRPIKGTIRRAYPDASDARRLQASAKDRAENVMITDLVRNDLGRVCVPGSITVPSLARLEPHPGVWHLVTTVEGTLREEVSNASLLRASFPPGSVTGAPKVRAMELISELESSAREVYTGAIGYSSPVAGLELNVAIRTFEISGGRVWLGAGGGIVSDSDPHAELEECFTKASPLIEMARLGSHEPVATPT
jgi:aminodeoxychorismate synthase component I